MKLKAKEIKGFELENDGHCKINNNFCVEFYEFIKHMNGRLHYFSINAKDLHRLLTAIDLDELNKYLEEHKDEDNLPF